MKPRVSMIVWTDWPALLCALSIPGIWIIGGAFPLIDSSAEFGRSHLLSIAVPISVVAVLVLAWRIRRVLRLFARGRKLKAVIRLVSIVGDRGRVEFTYDLGGHTVESWTPIHKNKRVLELRPRQEVDVLVDPDRPNDAIVAHLYV